MKSKNLSLNLGPKSTEWLASVGITTIQHLERIGSVQAFLMVRMHVGRAASKNLLYALEGAIQQRIHTDFTRAEKLELCRQAGIEL